MILSIGMIIKNEEKYLDQCLKAIKPVINQLKAELVIVDTGSTDRSVEIAKKYTDKIYHFEWINDFSAARNYALSKCHGEWFMYLDGDEILDNADEIINFFRSGEYKHYVAASHLKHEYSNIEEKIYIVSSCVRLFKNDDIKFVSRIHEYIEFNGPIKNLNNTFYHHYGYVGTLNGKVDRNFEYIKEAVKDNPYDIYMLSYYYSYLDRNKEYDEACERYEDLLQHLDLNKENSNSMNKIMEYVFLAYLEKKQKDKCEELITILSKRKLTEPILCRMYAWLLLRENDISKCEEYLNKYLGIQKQAKDIYNQYSYLFTIMYNCWEGEEEVTLYKHYLDMNTEAKLKKSDNLIFKQTYLEEAIKKQKEMFKLENVLTIDELKQMKLKLNDLEVYDYIMASEAELESEEDFYFILLVLRAGLIKKPNDETKVLFVLNNYMTFCTYYHDHFELAANSLFYSGYYLKIVDELLDQDKPTEALVHLKDVIGWDNELAYAIKAYLKVKGY